MARGRMVRWALLDSDVFARLTARQQVTILALIIEADCTGRGRIPTTRASLNRREGAGGG